jgi:hypothetical protein
MPKIGPSFLACCIGRNRRRLYEVGPQLEFGLDLILVGLERMLDALEPDRDAA